MNIHSDSCTHAYSHRHAPFTHIQTCTFIHMYTTHATHAHIQTHTQTCMHADTHKLTHTWTRSHTHTQPSPWTPWWPQWQPADLCLWRGQRVARARSLLGGPRASNCSLVGAKVTGYRRGWRGSGENPSQRLIGLGKGTQHDRESRWVCPAGGWGRCGR